MSDNPTDTYTVSFKSDEGYGAALLVVRGDNVEELQANLTSLQENELLETIVETKGLFHAAAGVATPAPAPAPAQAQQAAPAQGGQVVGEDRFCNHGKRVYKTGTNSRGKWEGWMCPQPKNAADKCEPVWG